MRGGGFRPDRGEHGKSVEIVDVEPRRAMERAHEGFATQDIVVSRLVCLVESNALPDLHEEIAGQAIVVVESVVNLVVELSMLGIEQIDE